ncbi:MAG: response regulator [Duganella sp.]
MSSSLPVAVPRKFLYEWLVLALALALVGVGFLYAFHAEQVRSAAIERDRLHVMTDFVANDIRGGLTTVDHVMDDVIKDYLNRPATVESSHFLTLRLRAMQSALPGVRALAVLDRNGLVTHASRPDLSRMDLSYRDYFKHVRDRPDGATLYISPPFQSFQRQPDLVIAVSRMVPDGAGRFGGVVVAILAKEYFSTPFSMGRYAPDVWAIVVHGDGQQIMNFPDRKARIDGTNLNREGTFFRRHLDSGLPESVLSGKVYTTGEQRLMNLRTIQPPGLRMDKAIVIGISRDLEAMALPLRLQAGRFAMVYGALVLVGGGGVWWMQRRRARLDAAVAALERDRLEAEHEKRLRKAERESEQRFRTLIEDAPLAIAIVRNGAFIYTNPRYRDLHGYGPHDDLTGVAWSAMISPPSRAVLAEQEALIAADTPTELRFEAMGAGKAGSLVPIFKTTTRVELIDGPATLVFAQDISAQKSAELGLLQARDSAEAASRSKADFLANMSHEIRSPLNAILGLAYLLEQSPLQAGAHDMVRKIQASGRMLLGIINDVLDVSKIEAGHMIIEQAAFRLGDVLDNVAATMGVAVGDKDIQLIIEPVPAGVTSLLGDALRLEQILGNLTGNAIKFTAAGRVVLRCAVVERDGDRATLRFSVTDTGIGIPAALHDEVFSAFSQADTSTTRRFGGTGLGLAICRRLVTLMGGAMGLHSTPGAGSQFWFTLPMVLIDDVVYSSPDMARIAALIADDSDIALDVITDIAIGLGWDVDGVSSGAAVLAQLAAARRSGALPDVVILDWKMPGMDGLATARAIRASMTEGECPIVIMATASSLAAIAREPGAEVIDAVLNKPVTASALYNATIEARGRREAGIVATQRASSAVLAGVRVLVVDDSDINRDVAQRILQAHGAQVALAVDGVQALDWLMVNHDEVDLVLMDVQMPRMDGIEATRQLRRLPQFDDLPIVALTAGAFKSQQETASAAGMTHFISKPFDVPTTIALIQRIHRPPRAAAPAAVAAPAAPDDGAPDAAAVIDFARVRQTWNDMDGYYRYLRRFVVTHGQAVDAINASLAADQPLEAAALAHKLAGVAGNLGLPHIQRLALEAERVLSMRRDPVSVLERLRLALRDVAGAIERIAPPPATALPPLPAAESARLGPLFAALMAALDTDNPDPVEPILVQLAAHLAPDQVASLREPVQAFDFRGAETAATMLANALKVTP